MYIFILYIQKNIRTSEIRATLFLTLCNIKFRYRVSKNVTSGQHKGSSDHFWNGSFIYLISTSGAFIFILKTSSLNFTLNTTKMIIRYAQCMRQNEVECNICGRLVSVWRVLEIQTIFLGPWDDGDKSVAFVSLWIDFGVIFTVGRSESNKNQTGLDLLPLFSFLKK